MHISINNKEVKTAYILEFTTQNNKEKSITFDCFEDCQRAYYSEYFNMHKEMHIHIFFTEPTIIEKG